MSVTSKPHAPHGAGSESLADIRKYPMQGRISINTNGILPVSNMSKLFKATYIVYNNGKPIWPLMFLTNIAQF